METDRQIIKQILKGNSSAFDEFITIYYPTVYNICRGFMHNDEDAKDMSQEVFIRIYNSLERFRNESSLSTWIYRICTNTCLTQLKKNGRFKAIYSDDETVFKEEGNTGIEDMLEIEELLEFIENELDKMGEVTGQIIRMRIFGMTKFKEIGKKLGLATSTASSIFTRSKKALQKAIDSYNKEVD